MEPLKINSPGLLLPGKSDPQYRYDVLVIPQKHSQFNQNTEEIIFKPRTAQEKYSDVSLSRNPEIQFDHTRDGRDGKASLLASQRTDSLGSEFEKQQNPISYSYDYAVNDGPAGPVISKTEQSDGVLTRVRMELRTEDCDQQTQPFFCLQGEYSVRLPNGLLQTVSYSVQGEGGFSVNVKYSGQD